MLVLRIIATVLLGISCLSIFVKNDFTFGVTADTNEQATKLTIISTIISWLWRAFVIVAIWVI